MSPHPQSHQNPTQRPQSTAHPTGATIPHLRRKRRRKIAQKLVSAGHQGQRFAPVVVPGTEVSGIALLFRDHALTRRSGNQRNAHATRLQPGDMHSAHGGNARIRLRRQDRTQACSAPGRIFRIPAIKPCVRRNARVVGGRLAPDPMPPFPLPEGNRRNAGRFRVKIRGGEQATVNHPSTISRHTCPTFPHWLARP